MSLPARALSGENLDLPSQSPTAPEASEAVLVDSADLTFLNEGGILSAMARVVMQSIGATGLSIAYAREGPVVCRASCGQNAPAVGTPLNLNSGIGAQCLREGKTVRCDDTESDPRVNKAVCRQIGVRSILAVPLRLNSRVIGIAQAFYTEPNALSDANVTELEHSADLFVSSLPVDYAKGSQQSSSESQELVLPAGSAPESASDEAFRMATTEVTAEIAGEDATAIRTEESLLAVADDQILARPSPDTTEAIDPGPQPLAEVVSTPDKYDELSVKDVSHPSQVSDAATRKITSDISLQSFAQAEEPVWWKKPTLTAVAIAGVCALLWIISHPLSQISLFITQPERTAVENSDRSDDTQLTYAELLKEAQSGNTGAQFALAKRFETGAGVPKSLTTAYSWYIIAGEGGNDAARQAIRPLTPKLTATQIASVRFDVARIYAKGVPAPDYVSAYAWMILAEAAGDRRAKAEQKIFAASMRPEQIAAAQRRASSWLKARGYSLQAQASPSLVQR